MFDISSHNGNDAEAYLKRGCKVIAVEANRDLYLGLHQRFASEIASGLMIVVEKAISRRPKVSLYVNSSDHGWAQSCRVTLNTAERYAER